MTMMTDTDYDLDMWGQSMDGCGLTNPGYEFSIMDGIRLISTNIERAPTQFDQFPIDSVIRLNFDMVPVISPLYGWLTLYDVTDQTYPYDSFAVAFTSAVDVNSVVITPNYPFEKNHIYRLSYKFLSNVQGDYVSGIFTFYTELFDVPPGDVSAFAVDSNAMGGDWPIDWDVTQVKFTWNTVALAAGYGYKIYAKDNYNNSDFIEVASIASQDHLQYQSGTVDLPAQFDYYVNDGMQTPFTNGTQVTFAIRAYNNAGMGPFSTSITLGDVVAPVFTIGQTYSADNTAGSSVQTVLISLDYEIEYVATSNNPVFAFIEAGGDESWAPVPGDVVWTWNNSYREDTTGYITLEAGECGAGDSLRVTISDNTGNPYTYTFRLEPYIVITNPISTTPDFEAPSHMVAWDDYEPSGMSDIGWVDYFLSFGGIAIDSAIGWTSSNSATRTLDDTLYSTSARVGIRDYDGGTIWWSETFTYNGIILTAPDSVTYDTMTIYDLEGTDSTLVPIAWNSAGLDSVDIWRRWDAGSWVNEITVVNTGSYTYWPPDRGFDYSCELRVTDFDGDSRPRHTTDFDFDVTHDYINITAPAAAAVIPGGATYNVTWTYAGDSTQNIIIEYSTNLGTTWTTLATTPNDGAYDWVVSSNMPADPDSGMLRFRDSNDSNTVASVGTFTVSGIAITAPNGGEEYLVGSGEPITWKAYDAAGVGDVNIYYSITGWADSVLIAGNETNDGAYDWSVAQDPSASAQVRVHGISHNVYDGSDANFTICGLTLTAPNGGENVAQGAGYTIQWNNVGTLIDSIDIQYDTGGTGWVDIASDTNDGSYAWTVANAPSTNVTVRVKKKGVDTGADISDFVFTISGIKVTQPNGAEVWSINSTYPITWERIGVVGTVTIEYTTDGITWIPVVGAGSVDPAAGTFSWFLDPTIFTAGPYTNVIVRVREVSGYISDPSDAVFTIQ